MSRRPIALLGALILATGLAGCGKVGQLERAAPMFGGHKAAAPQDTPRPPQDPTRPVETFDPRERASDGPQAPPLPAAPPPTGQTSPQ